MWLKQGVEGRWHVRLWGPLGPRGGLWFIVKEPRGKEGCIKTVVDPSTLAFLGPSFHKKMFKNMFHDGMGINTMNHAGFMIIYSLLFLSSFLLILKETEIYTFPWALNVL